MNYHFKLLLGVIVIGAGIVLSSNQHAVTQDAQIRRIIQTQATSECIGDPKTPLCAVDTFIACLTRRQLELCRVVGIERMSFRNDVMVSEYVILSKTVLDDSNIPDNLKNTDWYQLGFVDFDFDWRVSTIAKGITSAEDWKNYSLSVKPVGLKWHVASWAEAGYEDFGDAPP